MKYIYFFLNYNLFKSASPFYGVITVNEWKLNRDKLAKLIKICSDTFGGDDQNWLKEYGLDLINRFRDNLEEPTDTLKDILKAYGKPVA